MKPAPFAYHAPASVDEALATLGRLGADAKVLAGGQSLLPLLSMRLASPAHLVDLNGLTDLAYVRVEPGGVRIGAMARHADVEHDSDAIDCVPLLGQALAHVAHPVIRNRGTVVGSLAHADPSAEMPAVLALLGGSVDIRSVRGRREVAARDLFVGPLETSLQADELIESAYFPALKPATGTAFLEVSRRHGDYAVCGVAALVELDANGVVRSARAAYISMGPTPVVLDLADRVVGQRADPAIWAEAAKAARSVLRPDADIHASADYRAELAEVLTRRALESAAAYASRQTNRVETVGRRADRAPSTARPPRAHTSAHASGPTAAGDRRSATLRVNGVPHEVEPPPRRLLSDCLRHDLGLTGTHVGCEHGVCGCCTVLLDGKPVRSCLLLAVAADGHEITTIEGCANADGSLGPVQQAFWECHGLQCGFCTPGFVTTVTAFLADHPSPTESQAIEAISGNLCRCTGYQNIIRSVLRAAQIQRDAHLEPQIDGSVV